jgi:hypothetical protein
MATFDAPLCFYVRKTQSWNPDFRNLSGKPSLFGTEQIAGSLSYVWKASIEIYSIKRRTDRTVQAFITALKGRQNYIRIRQSNVGYLSYSGYTEQDSPHGDETLFDDDTGYDSGSPTILSTSPLAARASTIDINLGLYAPPLLNECITIDGQMVRIVSIENQGATTRFGFEPPLRKSVASGATIKLDGWIVMRLETDQTGHFQQTVNGVDVVNLSLIEVPGEQ